MKKVFLAAAIIGMTGFAFGQQQQTASKDTKTCTKSCSDKNCKKASCTKDSKKATSTTTTTTTTTTTKTSDKK